MGKFDYAEARARMRELQEQMARGTTAGGTSLSAEDIRRAAEKLNQLSAQEQARRMQEFQQHMMGTYQQQAAQAIAQHSQPHEIAAADAADDEWIEGMREGSTLTHEQAKMLGWLVKITGSAEQAAEELKSCMRSQSYHNMWTDRIDRAKVEQYERMVHQQGRMPPSLGTLASGYGAGRRAGKSQMIQQMYGAAALRPGSVWIVDDLEATPVVPLPERDPPKSDGDKATRSLRENFSKYNPFKRKG